MRAGLLNRIISIEQPSVGREEYGATTRNWEHLCKTRSKVTYSSGSRLNENNEIVFAYEVIFTIRIYHKVNERMRIKYNGRYYRILSIEENKE